MYSSYYIHYPWCIICTSFAPLTQPSLRRRFEQNQEDCTFTVLAILPAATENILHALPAEQILDELQKHKAERLARSVGDVASSIAPSTAAPSVTDEDSKSLRSFQSEGYVHASQAGDASVDGSVDGEGAQKKPKKTKAQLWNEMKISCTLRLLCGVNMDRLLTEKQPLREHSHCYIRFPSSHFLRAFNSISSDAAIILPA